MQEIAVKLKTASVQERAKLVDGLTKKQLEKLCKALGIKAIGHSVQLRNAIVHANIR